MRRSDMKVGEEYVSTGSRILVLQSPDANWFFHSENGKVTPKQSPHSNDPLGIRSGARERGKLWFKSYNFDAEGKRVDDAVSDVLLDARDVKGTWAEYLDLYHEQFEEEARKIQRGKELAAHREGVAKALSHRFSNKVGKLTVSLEGGYSARWSRNDDRFTGARVVLTLSAAEVAELLALSDEERAFWKLDEKPIYDEDESAY